MAGPEEAESKSAYGLLDHPRALGGRLEDAERGVGRRILQVDDADLPHDVVPDPRAFELDEAVERLVEGRQLRAAVHLLLDQEERGEAEPDELPLARLRERVDLADLVHVHRWRQELDDRALRLVAAGRRDPSTPRR